MKAPENIITMMELIMVSFTKKIHAGPIRNCYWYLPKHVFGFSFHAIWKLED